MQVNKLQLVLAAALISVILAACSTKAADNKKTAAGAPPPALPVDVVIVKEIVLHQSETVAGSIVPNRTVDIMSELPRKITAVSFKDGSLVATLIGTHAIEEFGLQNSKVLACLKGKRKTHKGFTFEEELLDAK